jgi:class 3 adenylate cyclase
MRPTGTVTLLFSDIDGSTRLLRSIGVQRYENALAQHRLLLRDAFAQHAGYEVAFMRTKTKPTRAKPAIGAAEVMSAHMDALAPLRRPCVADGYVNSFPPRCPAQA